MIIIIKPLTVYVTFCTALFVADVSVLIRNEYALLMSVQLSFTLML